ncbi:helix-turn-helix domain-containing protein [Marinomonas gallaica]|uniref:helix-turn-helix domain-containing protein n=1 Tax=Marinomonas gallaica TaxID=1806667 RepID=UPI000830EA04|nr:AraC family transcriptional regulator [Marinomonas gallaica]
MNAHHAIPAQYCFALDFKNYNERIVHYSNFSVLYYQFTTSSSEATIVVADGCADFQFCCDSHHQSAILWGSVDTPTSIHYLPEKTYCGIRVSTSISRRLAYIPFSEMINQGIPIIEATKQDSSTVDALISAVDFPSRVEILENWLIYSGALNDSKIDLIDHCIDKIISSHGTIRIADMSNDMGISERLLRKKFNQSIGMSPKQYSRIVRFQEIISDILYGEEFQQNHHTDFMGFSYYDDSHLTKDFKYFTHMTPSWFVRKMLDVNITRDDASVPTK